MIGSYMLMYRDPPSVTFDGNTKQASRAKLEDFMLDKIPVPTNDILPSVNIPPDLKDITLKSLRLFDETLIQDIF